MDVATLPGRYRPTNEVYSPKKVTKLEKQVNPLPQLKKGSQQRLRTSQDPKMALQAGERYGKAITRHHEAQENCMGSFLQSCKVLTNEIGMYFRSGLLLSVMEENYTYNGLLKS